jgi:hypothetical protein
MSVRDFIARTPDILLGVCIFIEGVPDISTGVSNIFIRHPLII